MQRLIFQDNQVHTTYSDGVFTPEQVLEYNRTHDQLDITFTDHVDKNTDWFTSYVSHLETLRSQYPEFSIRIGCEVKILDDGTINTTPEILKQAEVVLGSVHHFDGIKTMPKSDMLHREYELTKLLASHSQIDILAHPFSMGKRLYKADVEPEHVEEVYKLCVANGILFEYNHKNAPESVRAFVRGLFQKGETDHLSFGSDMHDDLEELGLSGFSVHEPIPVLVTGAGAGVGQGVLKALKLSKVPLRIVAVDGSELAAGLYTSDASYIVPLSTDENYIPRIIDICTKEKIQLVFVGTDVELEVLSQHAEQIQKDTGATVIVSPISAVQIADDKWKTVEFLKANGFPYPASCLADEVEAFMQNQPFPLIVKPRIGARSIGLYKVHSREELDDALAHTPNPIIQEYLSDEDSEYTCSAFFWKGTCYGVLTGKRWLRNGDTYKADFTNNPELEAFIETVGKKLDIFGPCNFQLRMTEKGPVIFEINCRFSGTTGAMSYLGFNIVNALVQTVCLNRPVRQLKSREAYMFRYWNEEFVQRSDVATLREKGELQGPESKKNIF